MRSSLIIKVCIVLSASTVLYHALGLSPSVPNEHVAPVLETVEAEPAPRAVAPPRPQVEPPLVVQVRVEEMPKVVREELEDPEDRADPVAKAQRDYEERNIRALRNPGIIPE
jgi:hypothetical protein